jgi:Putative prokaryotic signal transducing protein
MLGLINLEPILENHFRFLRGSAQFRMPIDIAQSQGGAGQAPYAILEFGEPFHDLGRRRLRPDISIECDFTFDLLDVFGNCGFAIVYWMDDLWNDACQWVGIWHESDYKSEFVGWKVQQTPSCAASSRSSLAYNRAMQDVHLVVVQSYASRPEAEFAKGALEAAGIPAMIQSDSMGGMREHLAWSGAGFKILVREEDVTDAREALAPLSESDAALDDDLHKA